MSDFGTPTSINPTDESSQTTGSGPKEKEQVKKERLRSLDTFRG